MAIVAAVMGVVVAGLAIPFAGVLGIGAKSLSHSVEDLPANLRTQPLAQQTKIVDQSGTTVATLYDQNRINVPLSQISRKMVKSIVAIEDYRYYQHGALDLKGTLRALVTNQASGGSVQGGSSITQQMVKMTLVDQAKTAKQRKAATADTYARKLTELRYAIAFEQNYSKDWILERYLNIAYYGDGAYGVQAAARHYFDTNAKDLTLLQGATLAGLVKNPSGYDPITNADRGTQRRNVVLDRLAQLHVIKQHRADLLKKKPLGLHPVATPNGCVNSSAPFFCDYVVNYLEQDPALGKTVDARKKLLYTGGLTIHTTISLRDQRAADTSVHNHVFPKDQAIGALAMVQPGTGDVKAISQSRPMGRDAKAGQTYLNYVVPQKYGDSNGFQPGSTFKAFVLAAAIQQGIPLSQTIPSPLQVHIPMSEYRVCGGKHVPEHRHLVAAQLDDRRLHDERLHRHPGVGEHLLRQARAPDRPLRALPAGQGDGDRPRRPRHRDGAVVHPRRRLGEPAGAGRRLRDVRRPWPPLRPAAGRLHRRLERQPAQDLRSPSASR